MTDPALRRRAAGHVPHGHGTAAPHHRPPGRTGPGALRTWRVRPWPRGVPGVPGVPIASGALVAPCPEPSGAGGRPPLPPPGVPPFPDGPPKES
ncbi:hypothetical protein GCM10017559_37860 [Streptosporangium longisporum]|uniref:Uncharacterized protein n=1 Tax=Streptosporangium longisporum TaxID=46187 RepID=A0ABN3Y6D3_9ACTN